MEKSAWFTPKHCAGTRVWTFIVCGSRNTIWRSLEAITTADLPSGVKYRLYGSLTGTAFPNFPVLGLIGVRESPSSLFTHRVFRSHDGTTCCGSAPTGTVRSTLKVFGSITVTVLLLELGT